MNMVHRDFFREGRRRICALDERSCLQKEVCNMEKEELEMIEETVETEGESGRKKKEKR